MKFDIDVNDIINEIEFGSVVIFKDSVGCTYYILVCINNTNSEEDIALVNMEEADIFCSLNSSEYAVIENALKGIFDRKGKIVKVIEPDFLEIAEIS